MVLELVYAPTDVFSPDAIKKHSQTLTAQDPNDMVGPDGVGRRGMCQAECP